MDLFFPIIGPINKSTEVQFSNILSLISEPEDRLISYIASSGGCSNVTAHLISTISKLPIKSLSYAGNIVFSGGAIIYSSFEERFAFEDSEFLIHSCIPPKGMTRTDIFDECDLQIWTFMAARMKISIDDLKTVARKGTNERYIMTSQEALEIGLVNEIIKESWRDNYKRFLK